MLHNISRNNGIQTMKFAHSEYNMRNLFLEKSYRNLLEKLFPDPFLKNQNWASLRINSRSLACTFRLLTSLFTWFLKKNISFKDKFHCLVVFILWDVQWSKQCHFDGLVIQINTLQNERKLVHRKNEIYFHLTLWVQQTYLL